MERPGCQIPGPGTRGTTTEPVASADLCGKWKAAGGLIYDLKADGTYAQTIEGMPNFCFLGGLNEDHVDCTYTYEAGVLSMYMRHLPDTPMIQGRLTWQLKPNRLILTQSNFGFSLGDIWTPVR